jgi:hypothetical protein
MSYNTHPNSGSKPFESGEEEIAFAFRTKETFAYYYEREANARLQARLHAEKLRADTAILIELLDTNGAQALATKLARENTQTSDKIACFLIAADAAEFLKIECEKFESRWTGFDIYNASLIGYEELQKAAQRRADNETERANFLRDIFEKHGVKND